MEKNNGKTVSRQIWFTINAVVVLSTMLVCFAFTSVPQGDGEPVTGPWVAPAAADIFKNPFKEDDASALAEGKTLYHNTCEQCHGAEGKGDGIQMITLSKKIADLAAPEVVKQSDGAMYWKVTTGNRPMPAMNKDMKADQRWKVILYVRYLERTHQKK